MCTTPFFLTKCYKLMFLYLTSPCLAFIQGHGAPGERGRDGRGGRKDHRESRTTWMKGGNSVMPYLLVTV